MWLFLYFPRFLKYFALHLLKPQRSLYINLLEHQNLCIIPHTSYLYVIIWFLQYTVIILRIIRIRSIFVIMSY